MVSRLHSTTLSHLTAPLLKRLLNTLGYLTPNQMKKFPFFSKNLKVTILTQTVTWTCQRFYPTLLLLLAGKNWKDLEILGAHKPPAQSSSSCEAKRHKGVVSVLPPSQTIIPGKQESVHSFNNYLTTMTWAQVMCQKPCQTDPMVSKQVWSGPSRSVKPSERAGHYSTDRWSKWTMWDVIECHGDIRISKYMSHKCSHIVHSTDLQGA